MSGSEAEGAIEHRLPVLGPLTGQSIDQVEADAAEMALRGLQRRQSLPDAVGAAQEGEGAVVQALQAEADAIDPGCREIGKTRGLDRRWVGLQRDLRIG